MAPKKAGNGVVVRNVSAKKAEAAVASLKLGVKPTEPKKPWNLLKRNAHGTLHIGCSVIPSVCGHTRNDKVKTIYTAMIK